MADTTGRILFWLISTVTGIPLIDSIGLLIFNAYSGLGTSL